MACSSCFPAEIDRVTMNTFRPAATTPKWRQEGWSAGGVDRLAILPDLVLESTFSLRHFEIEVESDNRAPMVYAPETQSGGFFNDQERNVRSYQWVEALSLTRNSVQRPARFQVRHRPAAFGVHRFECEPPGRNSSSRWFPCRAHRLRRGVGAVRPRNRVCGVRAGPLARELATDARVWRARRSRWRR